MSTAHKNHNASFLALVDDAKTRIRHIGIEEYQGWRQSGEAGILIDTREDNEWQSGHAAGAVHLGKGIIERDIESAVPDKNARLVLYCGGGYRSALAADALRNMGYTNAISLDGGWRAWREAGLPIE
ncbi:MAG: sulfurtransferase [Acidobacteriia bacterium]|nr:sulfurtransferase [Terriglobia bacterium]